MSRSFRNALYLPLNRFRHWQRSIDRDLIEDFASDLGKVHLGYLDPGLLAMAGGVCSLLLLFVEVCRPSFHS